MILSARLVIETTRLLRLQLCSLFVAGPTFLLCFGCQSSHAPLPNQPTATTTVILSPGDTIKLSFPGATDLNESQKIRADGRVSLPLVGEVVASGKTVADLESELKRMYKSQLRNNDVHVTLESGIANVVVSGYVGKPGKFSFDRPTTVFQAIMEAGGVSDYGNLGKVQLIRTVNGNQHTQVINLKSALRGRTVEVNYVRDGDVVYVPQKLF